MRAPEERRYGAPVRALLQAARERPRTLPFATPVDEARASLLAIDDAAVGDGRTIRDVEGAIGLRAALWLLHDFMDEAHALCNEIEDTVGGAYWHGILHRREPDAGNARYWMARVGAHPIHDELLQDARVLAAGTARLADLIEADCWRADRFVALCTGRLEAADQLVLLAIQRREWALLFDHEWSRTFG